MKLMALVAAPIGSPAYTISSRNEFLNASNAIVAALERIALGQRVVYSGDDISASSQAAGLKSSISTYFRASANIAQATTLLQVAQEKLTQVSGLIEELKAIAIQAAGNGLTQNQRYQLQEQFAQKLKRIEDIAVNTQFDGIAPLDGSLAAGRAIRVGSESDDVITLEIPDFTLDALFAALPDVQTATAAGAAQPALDAAQNAVQASLSRFSGNQDGFDAAARSLMRSIGAATGLKQALLNTHERAERHGITRNRIRLDLNAAFIAQIKQLQSGLLSLLRG